ncbi:hypothetical protein EDB19DRAFT_1826893 [Suillus lakei]|nr:hypothetical protein EDB19DRAFT_1826893 [Suillus lakei]
MGEESSDPHVVESILKPVRSYSDVVRTRADTPQPGAEVVSANALSIEDTPSSYKTSVAPESTSAIKVLDSPFLSSSELSNESRVDAPWKMVEHRHKKSKRAAKVVPVENQPCKADLVKEAEKCLTQEEKQHILERKYEGPSKGKNVDPRNWGGVDLEESELDIEAQREALSTWARTRDWLEAVHPEGSNQEPESNNDDPIMAVVKATELRMTKQFEGQIKQLRQELSSQNELPSRREEAKTSKKKAKRPTKETPKIMNPVREMIGKMGSKLSKRWEARDTPPAMDTIAQIAQKSYLGRAFEQIKPKRKNGCRKRPLDDSPNLESKSSMDMPPTEYDGTEDPRMFHWFIMESMAYVEDGNVPTKCQVFMLARYLKGQAHDFYMRQISDPEGWRLEEFFTELFNYCFPLDF